MFATMFGLIIPLSLVAVFTFSFVNVFATELNLTDITENNFTKDLKSKINDVVSSALNDTGNINFLNSSLLTNTSNGTSTNLILSENTVQSIMRSNGSGNDDNDDSNSIIKDKITTKNGVCTSEKVGGNGNDTLYSSGNCNDELTGGNGADTFTCGEGNDTIKDFNPKEGDIILDRQNCEKIE